MTLGDRRLPFRPSAVLGDTSVRSDGQTSTLKSKSEPPRTDNQQSRVDALSCSLEKPWKAFIVACVRPVRWYSTLLTRRGL
jgi:hypothetical protein